MRPKHWLYTAPLRLRSLFRRNNVEQELDDELRDHLDHLIEENLAMGMDAEEARFAAMRAMDGLEQQKEACRDKRRVNYVEDILQDVRFGLRILFTKPGFTVVAVLTLALGIGATTSIFSVVNSILLQPLSYPEPDRLVVLQESVPQIMPGKFPVSAPDVADYRRLSQSFEDLGAYATEQRDLTGAGSPLRVVATRTSAAVFRILRTQPALGRTFTDEEDAAGNNVVVLGHGLWQSRYNSDRGIPGKVIFLDRQPYTVIGVMPESFGFPPQGMKFHDAGQLWIPIAFTPLELGDRGDSFNYGVLGRLKPGVSLEAANADVMLVAKQIQKQFYPSAASWAKSELEASVTPFQEVLIGSSRKLLLLLLGAVGLLLLIACANVANLLLTRGTERQKEIAVRAALGAARQRLVRQSLVESTLLGLLGGGFGLLCAYAGVQGLTALAAPVLPRMQQVRMDMAVLWFALGLSFVCGMLFGVVPALATTKANLNESLKEGGRSGFTGIRHRRLRDGFVVVQIALALMLVTGSGLLVRSFLRARDTDPGIRPENVLSFSVALPTAEYSKATQSETFFDRLREQTGSLPAVVSVGMGSDLPLNSGWTRAFTAEGRESEQQGGGVPIGSHTLVDEHYFNAVGTPFIRGRMFNDVELNGETKVVIISNGMAKTYWPGEDPVGKRLKWGGASSTAPWLTVVGVVGDIKHSGLDAETRPHTFEPFLQACQGERWDICNQRYIFVRSRMSPTQLVEGVRNAVKQLDAQQPIGDVALMDEVVARSLAPRRFNTFLLTIFAVAALSLAAIGIYGMLAYNVARQVQELGVRIALGAQSKDILRLVLRNGLRVALIGLTTGLLASLACTRLMSSLLYGVTATDPLTFIGVAALFLAVAMLACWIPSRRATRVDPIMALRYE